MSNEQKYFHQVTRAGKYPQGSSGFAVPCCGQEVVGSAGISATELSSSRAALIRGRDFRINRWEIRYSLEV
jgi:hypothetical protein